MPGSMHLGRGELGALPAATISYLDSRWEITVSDQNIPPRASLHGVSFPSSGPKSKRKSLIPGPLQISE